MAAMRSPLGHSLVRSQPDRSGEGHSANRPIRTQESTREVASGHVLRRLFVKQNQARRERQR